mgnify:CR=1 FL=1
MCIAILKPHKETISKDTLETCFNNNSDGAGYMFAKDNRLQFFKGFFTFEKFYESYKRNVVDNDNPMSAIHFRITTHGLSDKSNCHPFKINENLGFIHNGVINMVETHKIKSDTSMFNNRVLKHLPKGFIRNQAITSLIEESIGSSKLVFLDNKGNYLISNENLGEWKNNIWFSNDSHECYVNYYMPTRTWTWGGHLSSNAVHKKKKKKKKRKRSNLPTVSGVSYFQCRLCRTQLITANDRNNGYCEGCDSIPDYSG